MATCGSQTAAVAGDRASRAWRAARPPAPGGARRREPDPAPPRATAIGIYEGHLVAASQGETFIHVRAGQIVVATGAHERPLLFNDNDRPGIMLASAILRLRWLHDVRSGERVVVVTDDDHGWRQAAELRGRRVSRSRRSSTRDAEGEGRGADRAAADLALRPASRSSTMRRS